MMSAESLLPTSSYLITVPFPSFQTPTQLVAHLTLFQGPSILLWCGECADGWTSTEMEAIDERQVQPTSSLLIEEHRPPRSFTLPFPTGHLTNEWAVAMTNPRTKVSSNVPLSSLCLYCAPDFDSILLYRRRIAHRSIEVMQIYLNPCRRDYVRDRVA